MTKSIVLPSSGNRWRRFIDKLAGGPPNLEKLERNKGKFWFVRYNATLFMLLCILVVLVGPEIVSWRNRGPDLAKLQTLQVQILRTHSTEPHLFVELPDGKQRGMEWPVAINFQGGLRSYVWTNDERERLPGCLATVRGAPLLWTFTDRFRVWELDCPEQKIRIGLEKTNRAQLLAAGFLDGFVVLITGWFVFGFVIFLREKRGNL